MSIYFLKNRRVPLLPSLPERAVLESLVVDRRMMTEVLSIFEILREIVFHLYVFLKK